MLRICFAFVLMLPAAAFAAERLEGRVNVVDADTWDVGGVRVRLHGIDAPEMEQTCRDAKGADWSCGAWVTHEVRKRFQGKTAVCVPLDRDRYGRIVAQCRVGKSDVGHEIVLNGLAFAYRKYSNDYIAAEGKASAARSGLHSGQVEAPWLYRASGKAKPSQPCRIKGNIASGGEKIFHVPGQRFYAKTGISPEKGERWFCSAAEAREAGWRSSKR